MRGRAYVLVLSLLGAAPLALLPGGAEDGAYAFEDGADDVRTRPEGVVGQAATANPSPGAPLDLRRVLVTDENETGFLVTVVTDPFTRGAPAEASEDAGSVALRFQAAEGVVMYSVRAEYVSGWSPAGYVVDDPRLAGSRCGSAPAGAPACRPITAPFEVDPAAGAWRFWVDKAELEGNPAAPKFVPLEADDALTEMAASTRLTSHAGTLESGDEAAAPAGQEYHLRFSARQSRVGVFVDRDQPVVQVAAGGNRTLPLTVVNRDGHKHLLELEYEAHGSVGDVPVIGPARVAVPTGANRTVWLSVAAPDLPASQPQFELTVRLKPVSFPEAARVHSVVLEVQPLLGPERPFLYLHRHRDAVTQDGPNGELECTYEDCRRSFLSLRADDRDRHPNDEFLLVASAGFELDPRPSVAVPVPLRLNATGPVVFALRAKAPDRPFDASCTGELRAFAYAAVGPPLATLPLAWAGRVEQDSSWVNLTGKWPRGVATRLEPGAVFDARLACTPEDDGLLGAGNVAIEGGASHLRLPLDAIDLGPDAFAQSAFQLQVDDRDPYVNPDQTRQVNLTIVNVDRQPHRAHLDLEPLPPGWSARLEPGGAFDVDSGETVRPFLLVHSPAGLADGTVANLTVAVRDEADHASAREVRFHVFTQIPFPDDEARYAVDPEAVRQLAKRDNARGLPEPLAPAALVVVALAAFSARRRAQGAR